MRGLRVLFYSGGLHIKIKGILLLALTVVKGPEMFYNIKGQNQYKAI